MDASQPPRARILCVDDEPAVVEGLELQLRRRYEVSIALSAEQALARVAQRGPFTVVISDMRMPGMDGATLLSRIRTLSPATVRMLLTGFADMSAAAAAVNEGQIFRFLTKPCPPELLQRAVQDAVEQNRLLTAERELLERTLRGAVQALNDVLSLTDPESFGRASRIQRLALALGQRLRLNPLWPLELAALLAPLGRVSLPPDVARRMRQGEALSADEQAMVQRVPEVTDRLIGSIPRLEPVREILRQASRPTTQNIPPSGNPELQMILRAARALRLATEYDELESQGYSAAMALAQLRERISQYEPALIDALVAEKGTETTTVQVRSLLVRHLQVGMVLAEDLYTQAGQRLIARGFEITPGFIERARNFRPGMLREPVRVILPADEPAPRATGTG
jgi:response regulator RpfG family c-di-GMP phosphodiesterase